MELVDLIHDLPWGERRWSKRSFRSIRKIIVHQAMSEDSVYDINNYHIQPGNHISDKGCPHICYHYCIDRDGTIYRTNPISMTVWHCRKLNSFSIGVLVMGNFSGPIYEGTQAPTLQQLSSLGDLIELFTENTGKLNITTDDVYGHCDFGKADCPGTVVYEFLKELKS